MTLPPRFSAAQRPISPGRGLGVGRYFGLRCAAARVGGGISGTFLCVPFILRCRVGCRMMGTWRGPCEPRFPLPPAFRACVRASGGCDRCPTRPAAGRPASTTCVWPESAPPAGGRWRSRGAARGSPVTCPRPRPGDGFPGPQAQIRWTANTLKASPSTHRGGFFLQVNGEGGR